MTTVDKAHDLFMSFKGRSPQQIYSDACRELGVRTNSALLQLLSSTVDDFFNMEELSLDGNYLGPRGSLAVIPLTQSQQNLKVLRLRGCGVSDAMIKMLIDVLQDHPMLRECDLADNPDISVYSGQGLVAAVKSNVNIVRLDLSRTKIGDNVAAVLARLCRENRERIEQYFKDDWFASKDMFSGLDVDGSGWVNIKNVVGSVPYPMIREKLAERIASMKPTTRDDNTIDVNTFMALTYTNYKTSGEIAARAEQPDEAKENIVKNWSLLLEQLVRHQVLCPELHKLRIRTRVLTPDAAAAIIAEALKLHTADSSPPTPGMVLSPVALFKAYQLEGSPSPRGRKFSSFLASSLSRPKHWQLPPPMLKQVLQYYEGAPPEGYPAARLVAETFSTDMEVLQMDILLDSFAKFALPLEETTLTLQEVVNLVDEWYDILRVNKPLSLDTIRALASSLG